MGNELNIPGAPPTIVPNINASNRALPRPISASIFNQQPPLDAEQQVKFPGDKQLVMVSIAKKDLFMTDGEVVTLVAAGAEHKLYDKLGALVRPAFKNATQTNYEFKLDKVAAVNLFLEVGRPAATPVAASNLFVTLTLFVTHPAFTPVLIDGNIPVDRKDVWIALLRFVDNTRPVERLFICDLSDNEPTVKEVQAELRGMGMEHVLDKIPFDVCKGDAWLQDQYQETYCADDRGNKLRMVWHLPRLRSETSEADRPNLSTFVDHFFPSRDVGLIKDFWQRKFTVTDAQKTTPITFRDTFLIASAFRLVKRFYDDAMAFLRAIGSKGAEGESPSEAWEQIRYVNLLMVLVAMEYEKSGKKGKELDVRYAMLTEMHKGIEDRFSSIGSNSAHVKILRKDGSAVVDGTVDAAEIARLYEECALLHDSVNYGGNIEVAPPASANDAPRAVIGTSADRPMDKTVVSFLYAQAGEPIEVDTSWLNVGHVDEIISFVPAPGVDRKWVILQNSTTVAFTILLEAVRYHFQDKTLDLDKTDWFKQGGATLNLGDETKDRFVSQVLRGKYWEYVFDRKESAFPQLMPPHIYLSSQGSLFTGAPDVKVDAFPANLSILEILRLERKHGTNRAVQERLDALAKHLRKELDAPDIAMLPAIFDIHQGSQTETFLPNPVNLQVVGNHLLMPRPFGPRMKAADAVAVMKQVFHPSMQTLLTTSFVEKMKLETQTLNIRNFAETEYKQQIAANWIAVDDYPDTPSDFEERLVQANRNEFNAEGYLKDGWRKLTIPEKTVDLFEFYMTVVLTQIGITVHWIDTWYYHIRHGGLHCGTNCIRKV
jgi:hypothetical protein